MSGKRHGFHAEWRVGFDDDGPLQALDATLTSDGGWSLDLSEPVLARALCHIDNAYWIPNIRVNGRIAKTHKTSQTAFRGFGGPQGMLVIEDILGRCAPLLGHRPDRRCGAATSTSRARRRPTASRSGTPSAPAICVGPGARRPVTSAAAQAEIAAFNAAHEHTKRALAMTPVKFGISFNFTAFNQAGALVHVYKDGSVLINHGGTEMGQGLHTKMLQVAATTLGVPLSKVRLAPTRTDKVPNTSATAASSGADLNGGAVKNACEQIIERLLQVAAASSASPGRRAVVDGEVRRRQTVRPCLGRAGQQGLLPAASSCGRPASTAPRGCTGTRSDARVAVQVLRLRRRRDRGRGRRVHRRLPHAAGRHRPRRGRQPVAAGRHRPDRGRRSSRAPAG